MRLGDMTRHASLESGRPISRPYSLGPNLRGRQVWRPRVHQLSWEFAFVDSRPWTLLV
jgi:hypothetical protein